MNLTYKSMKLKKNILRLFSVQISGDALVGLSPVELPLVELPFIELPLLLILLLLRIFAAQFITGHNEDFSVKSF